MREAQGYNGIFGNARIRTAPHCFALCRESRIAWAMRHDRICAVLEVPAQRAALEEQAKKINRVFGGLIQHDPEQIAAAIGPDDVMFLRFGIARMMGWLAAMDRDLALRQTPEERARTNTTFSVFLPSDGTGAGPETLA